MIDTAGMYRFEDRIYKVQESQQSGRLYAKLALPEGGFSYEDGKGIVPKLRASNMMTLAEAKEFGALYGVCCVCGRTLTDQDSIDAGIGPICAQGGKGASSFGWRVEIYQTDEERDAAILREREADAIAEVKPAATRTISYDQDRYGIVYAIRWDYSDPEFDAIKMEVKSWDWETTKRRWNPDIKAWTVAAPMGPKKPNRAAALIVAEFAERREFTVPEAVAGSFPSDTTPKVEAQAEAIEKAIDGLPMTFNDLLKAV